jgi:predicted HD phosphohydrolase
VSASYQADSSSRFLAHSANILGKSETLFEHLTAVSSRAERYGSTFGYGEEARVGGLLHDLGKYGERFKARLQGKETGIDHWFDGVDASLNRYREAPVPVGDCSAQMQGWRGDGS